jgi:hypothetical protein
MRPHVLNNGEEAASEAEKKTLPPKMEFSDAASDESSEEE